MTDPQKLPELEDHDSEESAIETRSKRQEKSITRNVEWFVNDFLPWSLGGLGGVGVIGFIAHSQVLEAIVAFVVTVAVVSSTKYARSFTRTFSTIAGNSGDQDAKSLAQWIGNGGENIAEVLRWYCSGFTRKYLKDQAVDCRDLDTEGLRPTDLRIPMLREVFVPLRLSGPVGRAIDEHDLTERELKRLRNAERDEVLEIWDLLRRSKQEPYYRQIAVQARGGYGKTTLLQHIALIYGLGEYRGWKFWTPKFRTPKRVPFLLRLRNYRKEMEAATIAPLPKLIHEHHLKDLIEQGITPPTPHWAEILLQRGDALVMLDGFDEVPMELREKVSHWITKQMQTYDNATFILTSRPVAYQEHYTAKRPATPIMVQSFTLKQQQEFVAKWYRCQELTYRKGDRKGDRKVVQLKADKKARDFWTQLQARPELTDLAGIPLLLNLLVTYHRNSVRPELPRQRLDLYRGICKLQLEDRPVARSIAIRVPYDRSMDILRLLAWKMTNQPKPLFMLSRSQILHFLSSQTVLQKENVTPEAFLKMVVEVAELLVEKEAGEYEFPHLSFQGFFAAEALIKVKNSQEVALNKWLQAKESPIWQEILPFFTAQLAAQDFQCIIRKSLKLGPDAVQTSAKCLKEYRNQDSQLQQEINALGGILSNSRYAKLEQLLKAGEWGKADLETEQVMLGVKDKDSGEYLTVEDIETFPFEDLLTIDNLWVTASNGHFGFSVQKKIWENCGSPKSLGKDWDCFCVKVGWKNSAATAHVSYSHVRKSLKLSPMGELPLWCCGDLVCVKEGVIIFSRDVLVWGTLFSRNDL